MPCTPIINPARLEPGGHENRASVWNRFTILIAPELPLLPGNGLPGPIPAVTNREP